MQVESSSTDASGHVRAALLGVARRAQGQFPLASGVGATLMVAGQPVFMASNGFTQAVDAIQYGFDEGPCVTSVETREPVWSGSIGTGEPRWPRFTERAVPLGLGSVLSAPVLTADAAIGSLNLYAREHDTFGRPDPALIERAVALVTDDLRVLHLQALTETAVVEVSIALRDRAVVDVAVGYLMDRYALTPGPARVLLGQLARQDGVSETAAAHDLIDAGGSR